MPQRKPDWLTVRMPDTPEYNQVRKLLARNKLHTVCQEANCPNRSECFGCGTATFLILGSVCTRGCTFCNISQGKPKGYDLSEADRIAQAVAMLDLSYAVITSVTRDDLPDFGSTLFALVIQKIREVLPDCRVELLIPDFMGDRAAFRRVTDAAPDVLNHNLETVRRLYHTVRRGADYDRSLDLFSVFHKFKANLILKSGLMVGLGETIDELKAAFADLVSRDCSILTIGQYLQPSSRHYPVNRFYKPEEFDNLKEIALAAGFTIVESGPLVRSSYRAGESYLKTVQAVSRARSSRA